MITLTDRHDLHIQISESLYNKLKQYSENSNESISRIAREAIQDKINSRATLDDIMKVVKRIDNNTNMNR